jgi:signal peptidase I
MVDPAPLIHERAMNHSLPATRKPWIAATLALFCTGLGHWYCGRIVRGVALLLASLVFVPAAALAAWSSSPNVILASMGLAVAAYMAVLLFAVVDAWRLAARIGENYTLRDYNHGLVYGALILIGVTYPWGAAYIVRDRLLEAFLIPSASMAPTILPGDRVLVNKLEYRLREPHRFDVVVFRVPDNSGQRFIKRLIGLPGDQVEVKAGRVLINGQELPQQAAPLPPPPGASGEVRWETHDGRIHRLLAGDGDAAADLPPQTVPPHAYFVLGDNRDRSHDSRHFSFVPAADLVGEAQCIYYPAMAWERLGALE